MRGWGSRRARRKGVKQNKEMGGGVDGLLFQFFLKPSGTMRFILPP